jgi:hypothetical protein
VRKPDEPGAFAFAVFNLLYCVGMVAVMIWVPVPHWGSGWLLPVSAVFLALFMAINVGGLFWSY